MKRSIIDGRRVDLSRGQIVLPNNYIASLRNVAIPTEAGLFSEVATQAYPLGTKLYLGDQIYRYCRAGAAMTSQGFGKCNYAQAPGKAGNSVHSGFEGALYAAVSAGDTSFTIADTAAVANEYEGAYFVVYNDTDNVYESHRVIKNDASTGVYTTLYIASPGFKNDLTTAMGITIYLSPYYDTRNFAAGGGYASCTGFAKFQITNHYFFWLQTAGPISGITGAPTWPGQTQYYRDVCINTDGSVIQWTTGYQRIGYLLSRTASDYGDNFVMLQLDT
jgi:hypothetical protein